MKGDKKHGVIEYLIQPKVTINILLVIKRLLSY